MLKPEHLALFDVDPRLAERVQPKMRAGSYTDAILSAFRYLTETLRERGGHDGDGVQLVGKALGGNAPPVRLNDLRTQSELDEQRGVEQLLRGLYVGIRNPRTHERIEDELDLALRVILFIDALATRVCRAEGRFDVEELVDRIFDPYFVASREYAELLVSQVPQDRLVEVFSAAFRRRAEGDVTKLKFAFQALFQVMSSRALEAVAAQLGDALRLETDPATLDRLFRLLKPDLWTVLEADVRLRLEGLLLEDCSKGSYDAFGGLRSGELGTWAATFGRFFEGKTELVQVLHRLLVDNWYTQNYVGVYFVSALPELARTPEAREEIIEDLAYATVVNNALKLRESFLRLAPNYPPGWKKRLRVAMQARSTSGDHEFLDKANEALSSPTPGSAGEDTPQS